METKTCNTCNKSLSIDLFSIDERFKGGRDNKCGLCRVLESKDGKECKTCSKVLPPSEFYSDNRNRDGLTHQCKECHAARMYKQRLRNIDANEENGALVQGQKKCSTCQQVKNPSSFSKQRSTKTGLCPQCKACDAIAHAAKRERYLAENLANYPGANAIVERRCSECGETKPAINFCMNAGIKGGLHSICRECASKAGKRWVEANPKSYMLKCAKTGAKERGIEFSITAEDIDIPELCPIFGFKLERGGKRSTSPSLDRIDNTKGYIPGNVVVVSLKANHVKSDCTLDELRRMVKFYEQFE